MQFNYYKESGTFSFKVAPDATCDITCMCNKHENAGFPMKELLRMLFYFYNVHACSKLKNMYPCSKKL